MKRAKKMVKYVPNTLSIIRIVLSAFLLLLVRIPWAFTGTYLFIGATDFFDGKIARRFHVESDLGSKLDTWGDTTLFVMALVSLVFFARPPLELQFLKCAIPVGICFLQKVACVVIGRVRFKTWNMLHTLLTKSVGAAIYFCAPVFLLLGRIDFYVVLGLSSLACITFIDETVTLLRIEAFDVNNKGIIGEAIMRQVNRRRKPSAS